MENKKIKAINTNSGKKEYSKPELKELGKVNELTQEGESQSTGSGDKSITIYI